MIAQSQPIRELEVCLAKLGDHVDTMEEALTLIANWSQAYPLRAFPEPDWDKAAKLLEAGGVTLDSISASCTRHVVENVGDIARTALELYKEN